jgi:hypothetical protein
MPHYNIFTASKLIKGWPKTPSPLEGEGWGEGIEIIFSPPPSLPHRGGGEKKIFIFIKFIGRRLNPSDFENRLFDIKE